MLSHLQDYSHSVPLMEKLPRLADGDKLQGIARWDRDTDLVLMLWWSTRSLQRMEN